MPGPGVVVERSYIPSQPYEIEREKNGEKTGGFTHVFANKSPKTPFFAIKYLTRYTHETFIEEYINFKNFRKLSHCGVIPVRSFGSQIRPQPHGLGLIYDDNEPNKNNPAFIKPIERIHPNHPGKSLRSYKLLGVHLDENLTFDYHT